MFIHCDSLEITLNQTILVIRTEMKEEVSLNSRFICFYSDPTELTSGPICQFPFQEE